MSVKLSHALYSILFLLVSLSEGITSMRNEDSASRRQTLKEDVRAYVNCHKLRLTPENWRMIRKVLPERPADVLESLQKLYEKPEEGYIPKDELTELSHIASEIDAVKNRYQDFPLDFLVSNLYFASFIAIPSERSGMAISNRLKLGIGVPEINLALGGALADFYVRRL